ncbi:MAG TPA: MarR family winged helix-turn-helix transcriptional regulator [Croceibacterium sp.]|nr:MarR family winged helix-turn-helix transcriptional regulator [Croceibacterium sp.]
MKNLSDDLDWGVLSQSVGPRARLLRNALAARSIAASSVEELPTGSLTVLALVNANPGSSQTALARSAGLNKSALVGIVDQLEQNDLIVRSRSVTDRRRNGVTATPAGEAMMKRLFAVVDAEEAPVREALGPRDMVVLLELLDRALAALDA